MWKRFALAGLVIVLLTAAASATAALLEVKQLAQDIGAGHRLKNIGLAPVPPGAPQTFLLLGSDSRVADRRRTDRRWLAPRGA